MSVPVGKTLFPAGVIGVSACLLGEPVRYDGGHKRQRYLTDTLGKYFHFLPVCPEVGCGLSTPRETMRLEGDPASPRLVTNTTRIDLTARMQAYCAAKLPALANEHLCGFIFKSNSPSCGRCRVKVYPAVASARTRHGSGLFAAAVARRYSQLPLEEEGCLSDPLRRENFIARLFCFRRWQDLLRTDPGLDELTAFHARHKLLMLAHSPRHHRALDAMLAVGNQSIRHELLPRYGELFMAGMALHATPAKNCTVLRQILTGFKPHLSPAEKTELLATIDDYRKGQLPLAVPLTLLRRSVDRHQHTYLAAQFYVSPEPAELLLRNR